MYHQDVIYGYPNARLKGMKTKFVEKKDLLKLAAITSFDEFIGFMEKTEYKQELVGLSILYKGADLVDRALGMNIARVYSRVVSISPEESLGVVNAFTGRWDVHNIKTILLGKHLGHSVESIERLLVPAGTLSKKILNRLTTQESVEGVVYHLVGTDYAKILIKQVKEYKRDRDINLLVNELDKFHYRRLTAIKQKGRDWERIAALIKLEIDSKNIITLMRYLNAGPRSFKLEHAFINGGRIKLSRLAELQEQDIPRIVSSIKSYIDLTEPMKLYEKDQSIVHFEIELERRLYERGLKAFRLSTLSVGSIVSFFYLKETETRNLRKIVRGIEFNAPREKIEEALVVV